MIHAEHKLVHRYFFKRYIHRLMKKRFHRIIHLGLLPKIETDKPLLITPNHISWWDGFFVDLFIDRALTGRKIHLMMLEEQLRKYTFFRNVGAFSVNPGKPKSVVESLLYAAEKLQNPENAVVIFPQGEIESQMKQELTFQSGVGKLSGFAKQPFDLIPLFFKIYYGSEREPELYMQSFAVYTSENISGYQEYFHQCYRTFSDNCEQYYRDKSGEVVDLLG